MLTLFSATNQSKLIYSVFVDDAPYFCDILPEHTTRKKAIPVGTVRFRIINNREKVVADTLFSAQKNTHTTLYICDAGFYFTQTPAPESPEELSFQFWKPVPEKPR